jgi:ubiquinone biosynthesis protein COQ9
MDEDVARKDGVIAALLPNVAFDGWTAHALAAAAAQVGADERQLFPHGVRDAVAWFSHWADRMTLEVMATRDLGGMRTHERVAEAVRTRLRLLAPHREAVRRAAAFLALPQNLPLAARLLYDTVDALWYAAGDVATDFSFYSKRAILAGIYAATSFYWLDDRSPDGEDTAAFLDRRLADLGRLPQLRRQAERALDAVPNPLRLLRALRRAAHEEAAGQT